MHRTKLQTPARDAVRVRPPGRRPNGAPLMEYCLDCQRPLLAVLAPQRPTEVASRIPLASPEQPMATPHRKTLHNVDYGRYAPGRDPSPGGCESTGRGLRVQGATPGRKPWWHVPQPTSEGPPASTRNRPCCCGRASPPRHTTRRLPSPRRRRHPIEASCPLLDGRHGGSGTIPSQ